AEIFGIADGIARDEGEACPDGDARRDAVRDAQERPADAIDGMRIAEGEGSRLDLLVREAVGIEPVLAQADGRLALVERCGAERDQRARHALTGGGAGVAGERGGS